MKSGGEKMTVGFKKGVQLIGISIVCFCMVFVCTFFLNYYLDASSIAGQITDELRPLYEAQLLTAELVCIISGCCLFLVSVVLLTFYIKLYIDGHVKQLGILKAMGYSDGKIAVGFWVFGLSTFLGAALGYVCGFAIMPLIYRQMGEGLPDITITFHAELLFGLVFLPSAVFALFAVFCAKFHLRRSALDMITGRRKNRIRIKTNSVNRNRPFLADLRRETLKSHKALVFFVAFSGFCFAAMTQMAASMDQYSSKTMGYIIFMIGIVLAVTAFLLAFTSLVNANAKTISLMHAYGYSLKECASAVLGVRIPAYIGFAVGTVYQYVLLLVMIEVVFRGVDYTIPVYTFNVGAFFLTLAAFAVLYEVASVFYTCKLAKISVREMTSE